VEVLNNRERLGVGVVAVAFAAPESLADWATRLGLDGVTLLADPERILYTEFGLGRASFARVWLDPRVWQRYAELLLHGRRLERPDDDTLQLGGDALVDAEGRIRWIYRSRGPEDRPSLLEIVTAVRAIGHPA
jgi:hypothetical protein